MVLKLCVNEGKLTKQRARSDKGGLAHLGTVHHLRALAHHRAVLQQAAVQDGAGIHHYVLSDHSVRLLGVGGAVHHHAIGDGRVFAHCDGALVTWRIPFNQENEKDLTYIN